jgi:hypothetical protein
MAAYFSFAYSVSFIIRVEQKLSHNMGRRKNLAVIEKVINIVISCGVISLVSVFIALMLDEIWSICINVGDV